MSITENQNIIHGKNAEEHFQKWLDHKIYAYTYLDQTLQKFPVAFRGKTKRPDFEITINNIGTIAVDVKYRTIQPPFGTFGINESCLIKLASFAKNFPIPIWYAVSNEQCAYSVWWWVSLDNVQNNAT